VELHQVLHRDIFKAIKHGLTERVLAVRTSAARCLFEMIPHAVFLYTTDLENVFSICFRSLEGSNYELRCEIAKVLGALVAITQSSTTTNSLQQQLNSNNSKPIKLATLDEVLNLLGTGFLKGTLGGFLKTGEMIKGNFQSVNKEVRVGVTHAYVNAVETLGVVWLERNLPTVFNHLLELLPNLKASTHMDAVYSRRCVFYILLTLSKSLSEKAQIQSIKVLITILNKYRLQQQQNENSTETVKELLVCILIVIGCIFEDLSTCSTSFLNENNCKVIEIISSLLVYPAPSVRIAASWCLRCIAIASPSHLTSFIDKCLEQLEKQTETSPEIIHGYSSALSSLIGAANQTPLGMPYSKGKLIFCVAEDLLRSASQNSRLSQQRAQSGWQLIGSIMTLGTSFVRSLLPRLMLIWKNSFPRTSKDLDSEKSRGDAFTWQITLENRTGALAAMASFINYNRNLVTDDIVRRLLIPIEAAILMLINLSNLFKNFGPSVKANCTMVRLRLYEVLLLLPANTYESSYTHLLRLLVSEFTLAENVANTTTSLLRDICHPDNDIVLGSWIQETDHKLFEDQLEPNRKNHKEFLQPSNAHGSGALEHDVTYLYKSLEDGEFTPGPLPLGVAIVNKSCLLYAHVFRFVANKHKLQMLNHFQDCIKHAKVARQEAIQINVLTVLISSLKSSVENKIQIGTEEIRKVICDLLFPMLTHNNPLLRCAAGCGFGRLCQITSDGRYVSELTQTVLEKLKVARDMLTRTGYSLALGFLHRFVGSLGSNQNLNTAISLLLALSQDLTSPVVQLWALHGLTMIVDSGGPMFRSYIDITLQHALKLLNSVPLFNSDVHQCIGKLLSALITTIGPELQDDTEAICLTRQSLLISCFIMKAHGDPLVKTEAISCFQQMHLFAPTYVDLSYLVPSLCSVLKSSHLFLRKAAVSCLYQLSQREAKEVCEHASIYLLSLSNNNSLVNNSNSLRRSINTEHGLAGLLFRFLDEESDRKLIEDVQKIITSLVYSLTNTHLNQVISLCKEVLTSSESNSLVSSPDKEENDFDDDEAGFTNISGEKPIVESVTPRWMTKVFATKILSFIMIYCEKSSFTHLHFNLAKALEIKESEQHQNNNYLVLHLSDLIRMAFMSATSENDSLRLEGLKTLNLIIIKFANVPEPEFQDHVILEQYQAQVGAALRPAFTADTPSHVTAMACEVCSTWTTSGVARDLNDLKRVHQLLVSSLGKLEQDSSCTIYNESSITLEKLAILKAWAEVYIVAMKKEEEKERTRNAKILKRRNSTYGDDEDEDTEIELNSANNEDLHQLVKPELTLLSGNWLAVLKDAAFLTLPTEYSAQLPHDGGSFYTADTIELARPLYRKSWSPVLHAACLWLSSTGFDMYSKQEDGEEVNKRNFHLLFGIAIEALCDPKSNEPVSYITECLGSLKALLAHRFTRDILSKDVNLSIELCNVLHRLLITREILQCQQIVLDISHLIVQSQLEHIEQQVKAKLDENASLDKNEFISQLGEGFTNGELIRGKSLTYALTELTLCVLIRQIPELSPQLANTPGLSSVIINQRKLSNHFDTKINNENAKLIGSAIHLLTMLPNLCNAKTSVSILPTVLYLLTGVLKESSDYIQQQRSYSDLLVGHEIEPFLSVVNGLKELCLSKFIGNQISRSQWIQLLQSTLAKVLDICKSNDNGSRPDEITTLTLIGAFVHAPKEVLQPPNLQFPCINLIKHFLDCNKVDVQLKAVETIKKMFTHQDKGISYSFIHALAPGVISLINSEIDSSLITKLTKAKYRLIINGLDIIRLLVERAEKKLNLLMVYLPLLMKLLVDDLNEIKSKPFSVLLHNYALDKLTKIAPIYAQEFKQIIAQVPAYRTKLENAVKRNQNITINEQKKLDSNQIGQSNSSTMIKLKTDFSNYS